MRAESALVHVIKRWAPNDTIQPSLFIDQSRDGKARGLRKNFSAVLVPASCGAAAVDPVRPVDDEGGAMLPLSMIEPANELPMIPLTVTHMLEHLYCPRFTYFEYVLAIPEGQERRPLVMHGRQIHEQRRRVNPNYLRRKLGVVDRAFDVPLASAKVGVRGSVDEILTLGDGSLAPFDYKFAPAPRKVYHNQKVQSALYGLLIQDQFQKPVRKGFICYIRSNFQVVTLEHTEEDYAEAGNIVKEVLEVIRTGRFPQATRWKGRCRDCCYRNICIQ